MGKIIRYQFLGSQLVFWFLCITVVGIPVAIVYLIGSTVAVEEDLPNPTEFLEQFRSRKLRRR